MALELHGNLRSATSYSSRMHHAGWVYIGLQCQEYTCTRHYQEQHARPLRMLSRFQGQTINTMSCLSCCRSTLDTSEIISLLLCGYTRGHLACQNDNRRDALLIGSLRHGPSQGCGTVEVCHHLSNSALLSEESP